MKNPRNLVNKLKNKDNKGKCHPECENCVVFDKEELIYYIEKLIEKELTKRNRLVYKYLKDVADLYLEAKDEKTWTIIDVCIKDIKDLIRKERK